MLSLLFWRLKCADVKEWGLFSVTLSLFKWTTPRVNYKVNGVAFYPKVLKTFFRLYRMLFKLLAATCAILVFDSLQKRETFLFFNFRSPSFGILAKGTKEHCLFNLSTDVNECSASPSVCHVNASCQNNVGSYVCSCNTGFTGDGKTCTGKIAPFSFVVLFIQLFVFNNNPNFVERAKRRPRFQSL